MAVDDDGSYLLRAGHRDEHGLRLAGDADRQQFLDHLHRRYCGDRYRSMDEWEADAHAGYVEDSRWYLGD
jgi:hypothetical protein